MGNRQPATGKFGNLHAPVCNRNLPVAGCRLPVSCVLFFGAPPSDESALESFTASQA